MADRKISDLTALTTPASGDYVPIVDISEGAAASKNKRITIESLFQGIPVSVGIGTTSPTATTHIYEASTAAGSSRMLELSTASGGNFQVTASDKTSATPEWQVNTGGSEAIVFSQGAVERARIDFSGRLLVGPAASSIPTVGNNGGLQLHNLANASGAQLSIVKFNTDTGAGTLVLGKSKSATVVAGAVVANNDSLGTVSFVGDDGTDLGSSGGSISCFVDGTPGADDMPGRLVFSTTADGSASPTETMRINSAQELLIGYTADNGAYKLQVNSQIFATSATVATSDGRYKENVATLNGCIDLVNALRPVSFDWKPQQDITRIDEEGNSVLVREGHNFPDGKQVGFIAQEVQEVLADKPWLGSVIKQNVRPAIEDADGNELAPEEEFFGIAEGNLTAVLTAALQEAIAKIGALEARIAALELN